MPCKNCNIETRSHDYATVDEAVFSPSRALPCRDESRIASPRLLPGNRYKILDDARVGKGTWPRQQWRHMFNSDAIIEAQLEVAFSRMSDQGFIGETEARLRVSSRWEIAAGSSWVASCEQSFCEDVMYGIVQ
jgi:hypothetical protein